MSGNVCIRDIANSPEGGFGLTFLGSYLIRSTAGTFSYSAKSVNLPTIRQFMKKAAKRFFDAAHSATWFLVPGLLSRMKTKKSYNHILERLRLAKKTAPPHNRPSYRPRRRVSSRRPISHPPIPSLMPAHAEPALSIMPLNSQNQIQQVPSCSSPSHALSQGTSSTRKRP